MKRDMELVREILLAIETSDESPLGWIEISLPGYSQEDVSYNVELLAEAGFIEAQDLSSMDGHEWHPKRLTWKGHEFLDSIRDPEIWRRTKEAAKKAGGWGIEMLWEAAKVYGKLKAKEKLGLDL